MFYDATRNDHGFQYDPFKALVVPRPIGWISSLSPEGKVNLAPYSYFNAFAENPHYIAYGSGASRSGGNKDTLRNVEETGEFVVNIATFELREAVNATSAHVPRGTDEFALAGLSKAPSVLVKPWRIAEAAIAMEARLMHHQEVGNGPVDLFLLEIVRFHLDDQFVVNGLPDAAKLQAVARCGGIEYCATSSIFSLGRP